MSVRVAVIDSGIGAEDDLGHGTAVASLIRQRAPGAELCSVKIFDKRLACGIGALVRAIEWCASHDIHIANLSVGTANPLHAEVLLSAVEKARSAGVTVVSAYGWLPGDLESVVAVDDDRTCPPGGYRIRNMKGRRILACSGASQGVSFAVANASGLLASVCDQCGPERVDLLDFLVLQSKL